MNRDTHVLSVLVQNHSGVLSRVSGLFSRRSFNIDSLSVGITKDSSMSVMTIVTRADLATLSQIKNQLLKLVEVVEISELTSENAVLREHVLVKVSTENRSSVMEVCDIFRANVVDISKDFMTAELTGGPSKINAFIELLDQYDIKSLVRTGLTGLKRGSAEEIV